MLLDICKRESGIQYTTSYPCFRSRLAVVNGRRWWRPLRSRGDTLPKAQLAFCRSRELKMLYKHENARVLLSNVALRDAVSMTHFFAVTSSNRSHIVLCSQGTAEVERGASRRPLGVVAFPGVYRQCAPRRPRLPAAFRGPGASPPRLEPRPPLIRPLSFDKSHLSFMTLIFRIPEPVSGAASCRRWWRPRPGAWCRTSGQRTHGGHTGTGRPVGTRSWSAG